MRSLLFFSAALAGLIIVGTFLIPSLIHPARWIILAFLFFLAFGVQLAIQWITSSRTEQWVGYYLGIIVTRLILSVLYLGYFIFSRTHQLHLFIGNFFVLYLCYTGFEIYWLLANLRRNSIS